MASNINLFNNPELQTAVRHLIINLEVQLRMVEGFVQARNRLESVGNKSLKSSILDNTKAFAQTINDEKNDNFRSQVSGLSLAEFCFAAISFEPRRLAAVQTHFEVHQVRSFMQSQSVSCIERRDIRNRLEKLAKAEPETYFSRIFASVAGQPAYEVQGHGLETTAYGDYNFSYTLSARDMIAAILEPEVCKSLADFERQPVLSSVITRFQRVPGDALVQLELDARESTWLSRLFPGKGGGVPMDAVSDLLGFHLSDAIEHSELRAWEKRNGLVHHTNCVQLAHYLRIKVANLHSIHSVLHFSPPYTFDPGV